MTSSLAACINMELLEHNSLFELAFISTRTRNKWANRAKLWRSRSCTEYAQQSKTSLVITPQALALANPAGFPTAATALQPTYVLTRANIQTNNFFFTAAVQGNITVAFGEQGMTTSLQAGPLLVRRKQRTLGGVAVRRTLEEQNKLHEPCVGYWHYQRRYSSEQYSKREKGEPEWEN